MSKVQGLSAVAALALLSGICQAQSHTSAANGNWNDPNTWNQGTVPGASSTVQIQSGHVVTITDARQVTSVTVSNGQLRIDGTSGTPAELEFPSSASSPSLSLAGSADLYLLDYARVEVQQNMTWSDGGFGAASVQADDYATCEIAIGNPSSASSVTLGVSMPVIGSLKFTGIGTGGGHSDGLVLSAFTVPSAGTVEFATSLESANGTSLTLGGSAIAKVYINVSLSGAITFGCASTVDVDPGSSQTQLSYGSAAGNCDPAIPASPITADFACVCPN
jgi:hypothetical protein